MKTHANTTPRLSAELLDLSRVIGRADLRLSDLMARLEGRVYTLFLVLIALPLCQPIILPGLSTPFGIIIAFLGLRFALRQKPWLPKRLLDIRIPHRFVPALLRTAGRVLRVMEKFLHPRISWIFDSRATQFLCGATICACGLMLSLPLPIPGSNILPAFTVVFIASAVSERDGVMLAAGGVIFVVTLLFFVAIFFGGIEIIQWLQESFLGVIDPADADGILPTVIPQPPGNP